MRPRSRGSLCCVKEHLGCKRRHYRRCRLTGENDEIHDHYDHGEQHEGRGLPLIANGPVFQRERNPGQILRRGGPRFYGGE